MREPRKQYGITLVAAMAFGLIGLQGAVAQQAPDIVANVDAMECPEMAYEVAYETPPEFIEWLLARPEPMSVIADAELGAMFRAFAERQQWRNRLAVGDGA